MGKYTELASNIYSIFGTVGWTAENIPSFPAEIIPTDPLEEFIRISIIPSSRGLNLVSVGGQCIIEIYTPYKNGPTRSFQIADKLDTYLVGKSKYLTSNRVVQFDNSTLAPRGRDKNETLIRYDYTIPFTFFGVQ